MSLFLNRATLFCCSQLVWIFTLAQQTEIVAGPMLGYIEMREAAIWVQTDREGELTLEYWSISEPDQTQRSSTVRTKFEKAFTAVLIAMYLEPDTEYGYRILAEPPIKGPGQDDLTFRTQPLWKHRTDPPDLDFLLGSCNYVITENYDRPGEPYGGDYRIFTAMAKESADLMLWLGDNTYFREPDWGSWSGMLARYGHTRALPELQQLLRTSHNYAIWDDHDFGPNNSDRTWVNSHLSKRAFDLFWANPGSSWDQGIATMFTYGDADFFLLDNRTFRVIQQLKTSERTVLGAEQIDILIEALKYSKATFKFIAIGGHFLNDAQTHENMSNYANERAQIIERIDLEGITGVIFLTGDRHAAELSKLALDDGRALYEITSSPLTSTAHDNSNEPNSLRVEGTYVAKRNYGMVSIFGKRGDRKARISILDPDGKEYWSRTIHEDELK